MILLECPFLKQPVRMSGVLEQHHYPQGARGVGVPLPFRVKGPKADPPFVAPKRPKAATARSRRR